MKRRWIIRSFFIALLLLCVGLLVSCWLAGGKDDAWYSPSAAGEAGTDVSTDVRFFEVRALQRAEAARLLTDEVIVPLGGDKLGQFGDSPVPEGMRPFLVRALAVNRGTGKFRVYQKGSALVVEHDSLGHGSKPQERSALVVFLKEKPAKVYVEVHVVE